MIEQVVHKFKQFNELGEAVDWLNWLETTGDFRYEVESIYSTPSGVFVVVYGNGPGWENVK